MTRRWHRFWQLKPSERWLLVQAALLAGAIRLGLWVLPFRTMRGMVERLTVAPEGDLREDVAVAVQVGQAVKVAARCIPSATCLTQALTAQVLLARRGLSASVHIGVAMEEGRRLLAHAWVESGGRVIVGEWGPVSYQTLLVLDGKNQ